MVESTSSTHLSDATDKKTSSLTIQTKVGQSHPTAMSSTAAANSHALSTVSAGRVLFVVLGTAANIPLKTRLQLLITVFGLNERLPHAVLVLGITYVLEATVQTVSQALLAELFRDSGGGIGGDWGQLTLPLSPRGWMCMA